MGKVLPKYVAFVGIFRQDMHDARGLWVQMFVNAEMAAKTPGNNSPGMHSGNNTC